MLSGLPVEPDPLPPDFASALADVGARLGGLGSRVLYFSTLGSTNDVAAMLAGMGHERVVVIADTQTAGRGRRGRTWHSPPGTGLYVSTVLVPSRARDVSRATALLTLAVGVALAESVERVTGLVLDIKWPNDLLVGQRKLAGILAESVPAPTAPRGQVVVVGYGINIGQAAYPHELDGIATSLASELGAPVDRAVVCAEALAAVAQRERDLIDGRFDAILGAWRARAPGHESARVWWDTPEGRRTGVTAGVDDMGALRVLVDQRIERLVAGEVHWH